MAFLRTKTGSLPWYKRLALKVFGPKQYREGIRLAHRTLGTEAVEVDD